MEQATEATTGLFSLREGSHCQTEDSLYLLEDTDKVDYCIKQLL